MAAGFKASSWALAAGGIGLVLLGRKLMQLKGMDVEGRVVLITGSSRGFGLIMAEEFARKGARLVLCARNEQELARARQYLIQKGAEAIAIVCDIIDQEQVQRLINQATEHYGRIDILVNNAGIITVGPVTTQTLKDFQESMNIMFWGTYYPTMAVLPQMLERKSGDIVNITSIGGKVSVPHLLPYVSAKFAQLGFSEGLHAELAKEGINVLTVVPGLMRTGSHVNIFTKGQHEKEYTWFSLLATQPFTAISARRAARQIVSATQRRDAEFIITFQAQLAVRFHGLLPGTTTRLLALFDRLLPRGGNADELERVPGKESETALSRSFLTALGQKAAKTYNQEGS